MRLFVAIDIPAEVKLNLRALLDRLRPLAKLKWSPVDNMHVTTKFIGEWPPARLEDMKTALAAIPGEAIRIEVRGLGWFPNSRRPRVFWAGVHAGEPLQELARATEQAAAQLGVPGEDRQYSPHLTLARIQDRVPLDGLRQAVAALESHSFGAFSAAAFYLYLSEAGKYTRLAEFPLGLA